MSEAIEAISTDDATSHQKDSPKTPRRWPFFALLQLTYLCVLSVLHLFQPDWSAALIVIPVWCWTVPAMLMLAIHIGFRRTRFQAFILIGWLLLNSYFFDSAVSLYREANPRSPRSITDADSKQTYVRVISFNCKDSLSEIKRLKQYDPDVILLQEAPGELDIMEAVETLYGDAGDYIWNPDCTIIVRGNILETVKGWRHTHAMVTVNTVPFEFRVVSTRLDRPEVRFDLWNIECWANQAFNRKKQRHQIKQVLETMEQTFQGAPTIIGGDFNCLHGNTLLNPFEQNYSDAHITSGTGWGKTFPNKFPVLRIDRIFYDEHWRVEIMAAVPTRKSDHRILICDLVPIHEK